MELRPETTELSLGLSKPLHILHITDLHLLFCDGRESDYMQAHAADRVRYFPNAGEAYMLFLNYLEAERPDAVVLTGDILDFPARKNIEALEALLRRAGCPFLFVPGNHDWSLPKDYHSKAQYDTYMPLFDPFDGGTPDFQCLTVGGVRLIGVDDSRDRVSEGQLAALQKAASEKTPYLLFAHVPLYADTLIDDVVRVWRAPIVIGHEKSDDITKAFCACAAESASAVFTGHIHFSHTDILPGGRCTQYVTGLSAEGTFRRILIK